MSVLLRGFQNDTKTCSLIGQHYYKASGTLPKFIFVCKWFIRIIDKNYQSSRILLVRNKTSQWLKINHWLVWFLKFSHWKSVLCVNIGFIIQIQLKSEKTSIWWFQSWDLPSLVFVENGLKTKISLHLVLWEAHFS